MNGAGAFRTYFDTLPDDVRVKPLEWLDTGRFETSENEQYLRTAPFTLDGRGFLSFLFSEHGPFCKLVSSVLTKVSLSLVRNSTNVYVSSGQIIIGPELFEDEELGRGFVERVLRACGESMKVVSLAVNYDHPADRENDANRFIRQFVSLVIQYCPAVERLEFRLPFPNEEIVSALFATFSSQLHSIESCSWGKGDGVYLPDVSDCTQIRELSLSATPQLMLVLERVGSQVESLYLGFDTFEGCGEVLDAVERNCKKLMHFGHHASRGIIHCVGEKR